MKYFIVDKRFNRLCEDKVFRFHCQNVKFWTSLQWALKIAKKYNGFVCKLPDGYTLEPNGFLTKYSEYHGKHYIPIENSIVK